MKSKSMRGVANVVVGSLLAAGSGVGLIAACSSSDTAPAAGTPDASVGSSGGNGGSAPEDAGNHPPPNSGGQAAFDAGPLPCPEHSVRCNHQCVSASAPTAGNCSFVAELEAVTTAEMASNGDIYAATAVMGAAPLWRIPSGGGTPVSLMTDQAYIQKLIVEDTNIFFETQGETSTRWNRITGSIGQVPRQGGTAQWLVRDIPDGVFVKTADHFYVGARDLSPGLRRFDIDGSHETLMTKGDITDIAIVGTEMFLLDDDYTLGPIKHIPLAFPADGGILGGDAGTGLPVLGGGQCQELLGVVGSKLYALCNQPKIISLPDGAATVIAQAQLEWDTRLVLNGNYLYYAGHLKSALGHTIDRMSISTGTVEQLATFDSFSYAGQVAVNGTGVYFYVSSNAFHAPAYFLKITP